jgi:hypothetical protein
MDTVNSEDTGTFEQGFIKRKARPLYRTSLKKPRREEQPVFLPKRLTLEHRAPGLGP